MTYTTISPLPVSSLLHINHTLGCSDIACAKNFFTVLMVAPRLPARAGRVPARESRESPLDIRPLRHLKENYSSL
jgi:hypothetical protein